MRIASASRKASIGAWLRQRGRLGATDGGHRRRGEGGRGAARSRWCAP
jgi:hypothetical protein